MEIIANMFYIIGLSSYVLFSMIFHEIGHGLVFRYYGVKASFGFDGLGFVTEANLSGDDVYRMNTEKITILLAAGSFFSLVWLLPILILFFDIPLLIVFLSAVGYNIMETTAAPIQLRRRFANIDYFFLENKEEHDVFYRCLREEKSSNAVPPLIKMSYETNPFLDVLLDLYANKKKVIGE